MLYLDTVLCNSPLTNFADIRPVGAALIRAADIKSDGELDRHDGSNGRFFYKCEA